MTRNYLDILAETIRNNWDQPALTDFYLSEDGNSQDTSRGNHYTYGEMYAEIVRVADLLVTLGLQKGDHIAVCGTNSAHWAVAYLAIAKMQGVSVTVMHSLQPDQIAQMINFSDAKALIVDKDIWENFKEQSLPQVVSVIALEDFEVLRGKQIINHKSSIINEECGFPHSEPDSLAMICFTSGSSGMPKGVMLSYRNISATIRCVKNEYKMNFNKKMVIFLPMAHLLSTMGEILSTLIQGATLYIIGTLSFENYIRVLDYIQPFEIVLPPVLLDKLLDKHYSLLNLDYCVVGGAVVTKKQAERTLKSKLPLTVGYGLTETSALIGIVSSESYKIGTCGKVCDTLTCRIAPNGEILVKGENVMLGYYKDPEATAAKIDKDGWLHTGDKGHLDEDGYLYVEGRLEQDIIVLPNGENIRPDNIEAIINTLPEVSESIVFARDGKLVARVVVPSSLPFREESEVGSLRRMILRQVNPQLPLFSQLYDVEITNQPLAKTEKQTLKRYLYK